MHHSQCEIELAEDGNLKIGATAKEAIQQTMETISLEHGIPADPDWAAYVLLLTDSAERDPVDLCNASEWVWNRRFVEPHSSIRPEEILNIKSTRRFPRLPVFTIWIKEDDGLTFSVGPDAIPVLNSVVGRLQRSLNQPVEWHHVLGSLAGNFPPRPVVLNNRMWSDYPELYETVLASLRQLTSSGGCLPKVAYQDEEDTDYAKYR